jgi:hypothetical protein
MHLSNSLLNLKSYFYFLVFGKFDDGNANFLLLIAIGVILNWLHWAHILFFRLEVVKDRANMQGSNFHDILSGVLGLQYKISFADLAILNTFLSAGALPRVLKLIDCITDERNQADPLAKKLIMQD